MLRTQTVEKRTLDLIQRLMEDETLNDFNLVGGTALALKIGHRLSIDIDLFSINSFDAPGIATHLTKAHSAHIATILKNGVFSFIDKIKIDVLAHQYPLVEKVEFQDGIRMVSLKDIGAMKLNAIYNNGTRLKDFIDIYALLELFTLNQLLLACFQKYPDLDINMVKRALTYYDDIDFADPVKFVGSEIPWPNVAERLNKLSIWADMTAHQLPQSKAWRQGPRR